MDAIATVVLRRAHVVQVAEHDVGAPDEEWVRTLESDLVVRGCLLSATARDVLSRLTTIRRVQFSDWLAATIDSITGADRDHTPLFAQFPEVKYPHDELFVNTVLTQLLQSNGAPCVLCGVHNTVEPLVPCGHVACSQCFDSSHFSGCPICGRRTTGRALRDAPVQRHELIPSRPVRWMVLDVTDNSAPHMCHLRDSLVTRPYPLAPQEQEDLKLLIGATAPGSLQWLPEDVPSRVNLAIASATALQTIRPDKAADLLPELRDRWTTATDVARTLWAYSDGDPGLVLPTRLNQADRTTFGPDATQLTLSNPKVRALPRWLRRGVLEHLESCDLSQVAEDLCRHRTIWKRIAERLHPFEYAKRYPQAATCFAIARSTRATQKSPVGRAIAKVQQNYPDVIELRHHENSTISAYIKTSASRVEAALAEGHVGLAVSVLRARPGELWRRLDHLVRVAGDDEGAQQAVADAAQTTVRHVSAQVLLTTARHFAHRIHTTPALDQSAAVARRSTLRALRRQHHIAFTQLVSPPSDTPDDYRTRYLALTTARRSLRSVDIPQPGTARRVFFPRGDAANVWVEPEYRDAVPRHIANKIIEIAYTELARRAAAASADDHVDVAIIDSRLADVPLPSRTQVDSGQLTQWPRGTTVDLPDHSGKLRFFMHWTDSDQTRVDLDLSCAFLDADWNLLGSCDYTQLSWKDAVHHSGDLTSAPPPGGATEFIDLDLPALDSLGAVYAIPIVFSYNNVPFDELHDAFAGVMLPQPDGATFQADRVLQRFDLRGPSKVLLPLIANLRDGSLTWVDTNLTSLGGAHSIARNVAALRLISSALYEVYDTSTRPTVFDLTVCHALGRAKSVVVSYPDGQMTVVSSEDCSSALEQIYLKKSTKTRQALSATSAVIATKYPDDIAALKTYVAGADVTVVTGLPELSHEPKAVTTEKLLAALNVN